VVQGTPYLMNKTYLRFESLFLPLGPSAIRPAPMADASPVDRNAVAFVLFAVVSRPAPIP